MHSPDWDDLRFVLAVADCGTLSAAARVLNVTHATVLRRIQAFEEAHGGAVFERGAQGYRLLPERIRVIDAAREVAQAVASVQNLMQGGTGTIAGLVRLASTDTLCQSVLPGFLAEFAVRHPEVRVEVMQGNAHHDLARAQADLALRPAMKLPDDMEGESPCSLGFAVYGRAGVNGWLGLGGILARTQPSEWMEREGHRVVAVADSFQVLARMVAAGVGQCFLPCILGDTLPGVERRTEQGPRIKVPLWVASHGDLREVPRIRLVRNRLVEWLGAQSVGLAGDGLFAEGNTG